MEEKLTRAGTYCPNPSCELHGQTETKNVIRYGKTSSGVQRYQCTRCGRTFTETRGTVFFKKHRSRTEILETLALLAEGVRISSLSRAKGIKEDTILHWLREAARHAESVEEALLSGYSLSRVQVDGLWAYVGRKKGVPTPSAVSSGVAR